MRKHEHDHRPETERVARRSEQPLDGVFALQRGAGNQAVAALLARQPTETKAPAATATVSKLGVIPLLSFSTEHRQGRGESTGGILCVSAVAAHSAKLQQLMSSGAVVDVEIVAKSGFKLKLEQALISSYSTAESEGVPTESWTLEPGKMIVDDGKGGGGGGGGGRDRSLWDDPHPG